MRILLLIAGLGTVLSAQDLQFPGSTPGATQPGIPVNLTLPAALERARVYSQQVYSADFAARIAREDTVQAKAALLPTADALSGFIYTQPNGTPTGVFVANNGPRVYSEQVGVHADVYNPVKLADYRRATAAEAVVRARADLAARGVAATVVQNYYGLVVSQRKLANAQRSLNEAQQFLDITQKLQRGGEAARSDVVKAEIQIEQRRRDVADAELAREKARLLLGILLFPDYGPPFTVTDDLETPARLPAYTEIQTMAAHYSPDIRAALATVRQQTFEKEAARAAMLPALTFDYFFGINANQFAIHGPGEVNNLGSSVQAQLTIPVWTWGAARSKVRQADLRLQQARSDLSFTRRSLLSTLDSFYLEAQASLDQLPSLKRSMDLSADSLRLTLLRYQAGEATVLEVVDAQSTLAQARNSYDDGLLRQRLAQAGLQTLTGGF